MRRVIWSVRARADLLAIQSYIARFDPAAAARVATRLADVAESLRDFPDRGTPIAHDIRQLAIVYPYLVRYRVRIDEVEILRVRHGARRPTGKQP